MRHLTRASVLFLAAVGLACTGSPAAVSGVDAGTTTPSFSVVAALPPTRAGAAFQTIVTVKGGPRADVRWSVTGSLPPGVTFNVLGDGDLSIFGTPLQSGSFTFTLDAVTADGQHASTACTLVVDPIGQMLGDPAAGVDGEAYLATLDILGASHGEIRWSVASGTLPPGITLAASDIQATLSGTPVEGVYSFTLVAADDTGILAHRDFAIVVGPHLSIEPTALPDGLASFEYNVVFQATGGADLFTWTVSDSSPPGFQLTQASAANFFHGVPATPGTYSFNVTVTDSAGASAQRTVSIVVHANLQLSSAMPAAATIATGYTGSLTATGAASDLDYQWSVSAGVLPFGLSLTTAGGVATVAGVPFESGVYDFVVAVSLPTGETASQMLEISVAENPPQILTAAVPDGTWSTSYSATVTAHSAVGAPWQWFVADGAVPPGVTLSGTDTEQLSLSGKPRFTGTFAFTLGFSDARQTTFASYSMTVAHLDQLEVLAAILGKARVGHAYAAQIETRGATGAVSFALERGGLLPPGLTLLPDGSIAGSPMASGNFAFSIVASDAAGNTAHRQFAIAVAPDRSILVAEMGLQAPLSLVARDVSTTTPGPVIPLAANLGFGADFTFSLDPNRFSFTTGNAGRTGSLFVVDLNQPSPIVEIANGTLATEVNGAALRWAPDGNRFAYATEQSVGSLQFSHFIAPADDPAAAVLPIADGLPCLYAGFWSPDAAFYATGAADGSAIYVSDGSSTRTFPLDNGRRFGSVIGWSPDSALVLVMALEPSTFFFRIFALDISADQPALFPMTPPDAQIFDYALSDDGGGFAAFAVNANNSIFVSDLRSPQLTAMTQVFLAQPTGIRWSPDSRRLAVTGVGPGNGTLGIVERDQLSSPVSIADALTSVLSFKWSADSQSVIATTPNATLAIPVNGGPPDTLVTGAIDFFAGVLPGEPPLFVYSDATGVSSVNVSAPHTKVTLDPVAIPEGLAVAPSRRAVFYSRLAGSTSLVGNVSMVDLGGPSPSAPIDVLDFDAGVTTVVVSDASIVFVP